MASALDKARHVCNSVDFDAARSNARAEANHGYWAGVVDLGARYAVYAWPADEHPTAKEIVHLGIVAWEVPS